MSITVDYFFNYADNLAAVAEQVNMSIGCSLLPYQGDPNDLYCRFFNMDLNLEEPKFENDGDLNFEDYEFHLSLRTSVGMAPLRPIQIPAMASVVYALCVHSHITGMLVFDGQVLLARYEERTDPEFGEDSLYDTVSGGFVRFPLHLNTLESRLSEDWRATLNLRSA
jgi:hypothetical protein